MRKLLALVLMILFPYLLIGCVSTPEEREYRKNKAIMDAAIMEAKPKPVIKPSQAVISDILRNR